jgi:hypothetical protein
VTELVGVGRELKKTIGWQYTTSKVRKQDGEGTFAGTRGNDRVAPIPAVRTTAIVPRNSTQSGHRRNRVRTAVSARKRPLRPGQTQLGAGTPCTTR